MWLWCASTSDGNTSPIPRVWPSRIVIDQFRRGQLGPRFRTTASLAQARRHLAPGGGCGLPSSSGPRVNRLRSALSRARRSRPRHRPGGSGFAPERSRGTLADAAALSERPANSENQTPKRPGATCGRIDQRNHASLSSRATQCCRCAGRTRQIVRAAPAVWIEHSMEVFTDGAYLLLRQSRLP